MGLKIRPFRRADRDQLTKLINANAEAVVPGSSIPDNTVLAQLEREPGEFIVDPWMHERLTLVVEATNGIVAAALMLRYRSDADVPDSYRSAGEIRWLLFEPLSPSANPHWNDGNDAAHASAGPLDEPTAISVHNYPSKVRKSAIRGRVVYFSISGCVQTAHQRWSTTCAEVGTVR